MKCHTEITFAAFQPFTKTAYPPPSARPPTYNAANVSAQCVADGILLEPEISEVCQWFAELDRVHGESFLKKGRKRPTSDF